MNFETRFVRAAFAVCMVCACASVQACALDTSPTESGACAGGVAGAAAVDDPCTLARETGGATEETRPMTLASVLTDKGGQYVDVLARDGVELPRAVTALVDEFTALESFPGAFTDADVRRVRILPGRQPGAAPFLRGGQAAITLDSLVIFEDARYDALMGLKAPLQDVLSGALSPAQDGALFTLLHELVHVRQFRELGREQFLSEYLADLVSTGQQSVELEQAAYAIAPGDDSWSRTTVAAIR